VTAALTKLESTHYYQGRKVVDDYIDEFSELIDEVGYTDGLSVIMGWYSAARIFNANRTVNQAFHGTQRTMVPSLNV
jgi:hypothetical protein